MSEISNKVLEVLLEQGIKAIDIPSELYKIQNEIETTLWEKTTISPVVFYTLKDTIFFNFEHLSHTDSVTGRTNLKSYGQHYPVLMFSFNGGNYIEKEYVPQLLKELEDIKTKWNSNIYVANLHSKVDFDWKVGEENPSKLIVYNKDTESPTKYGYYSNTGNYSNIYGADGAAIKKSNEVVLCAINKVDLYREYNLLTQALDNLYNTIKKAATNDKGIHIDFNGFNYEQ